MKLAQMFCTVSDMQADLETPGGNEARLYRAIREASEQLAREIGWFIPVRTTVKTEGEEGEKSLYLPAFLALTGNITNYNQTLTAADVILQPTGAYWPNGPYDEIEIRYNVGQVWSDVDEDVIEVPLLRGLYNHAESTGALLDGALADDDASITVDDGSKVSAGMVLKVEDEQLLVTGTGAPVEAVTALAGAATLGDESLLLDDLTLVHIGEVIRVDFEQMLVLDKSATRVAVKRGWNNTAKTTHAEDADVDVFRTYSVERGVNGTTPAAHADQTPLDRYVAPANIQYLTAQIATLMLNKAKGGYAGRTGNADTGTVFYNDAFPRFEIERIAAGYTLPRMQQ